MTSLTGLNEDFRDLLAAMVEEGVEFVIVGARRIDILTEISGVSFDEAWATREATDLDGRVVYFIGRNEFLRNKRATGRTKDLADAERLKP